MISKLFRNFGVIGSILIAIILLLILFFIIIIITIYILLLFNIYSNLLLDSVLYQQSYRSFLAIIIRSNTTIGLITYNFCFAIVLVITYSL